MTSTTPEAWQVDCQTRPAKKITKQFWFYVGILAATLASASTPLIEAGSVTSELDFFSSGINGWGEVKMTSPVSGNVTDEVLRLALTSELEALAPKVATIMVTLIVLQLGTCLLAFFSTRKTAGIAGAFAAFLQLASMFWLYTVKDSFVEDPAREVASFSTGAVVWTALGIIAMIFSIRLIRSEHKSAPSRSKSHRDAQDHHAPSPVHSQWGSQTPTSQPNWEPSQQNQRGHWAQPGQPQNPQQIWAQPQQNQGQWGQTQQHQQPK